MYKYTQICTREIYHACKKTYTQTNTKKASSINKKASYANKKASYINKKTSAGNLVVLIVV